MSPAAAAIVAITKGAQTTLAVETGGEGLWEATWVPGAAPLTWTQVAPPAGLPGGVAREVAYVPGADALFLSGLGTLSRIDQPDRCVGQACPLAPVLGARRRRERLDAADDGLRQRAPRRRRLDVVRRGRSRPEHATSPARCSASMPTRPGGSPWTRMADPDGVAANQLIRPIAVAAESGRLAITTSGNGLVVYGFVAVSAALRLLAALACSVAMRAPTDDFACADALGVSARGGAPGSRGPARRRR